MESPNFVANGTIAPSVFVTPDGTLDNHVVQASTNQPIQGVSQNFTDYPPIPSASTNAAVQGESLKVYGNGTICMLKAGSGGWVQGNKLKSDNNGCGVPIAASGTTAQEVGAIALTNANAGEYGRVQVFLESKVYPALS